MNPHKYTLILQLCQICRKDDNEAQLLLCDGCDRGYHTYCFKVIVSCFTQFTVVPPDSFDFFCLYASSIA